jgi:hypothetical protein
MLLRAGQVSDALRLLSGSYANEGVDYVLFTYARVRLPLHRIALSAEQ